MYSCGCLNVKLHVVEKILNPVDKEYLSINARGLEEDEFGRSGLALATLDSTGIQVEHAFLINRRLAGKWSVNQCLNCSVTTHAVFPGAKQILMNAKLISGSQCENLKSSEHFSTVFKVVIREDEGDHIVPTTTTKNANQNDSNPSWNKLQHDLKTYLQTEQMKSEIRIREFTEQERIKHTSLEERCRKQKDILYTKMLLEPQPQKNKIKETSNKSLLVSTVPLANQDHEEDLFAIDPLDDDPSVYNLSEDDDENDDVRNKNSEDENNSSDDDDDDDDDGIEFTSGRRRINANNYSCSVPINIPVWGFDYRAKNDKNKEKNENVPNDIAASMRAMAQSLREDGTEIFGDLPTKKASRTTTNFMD